MKVSSIEFFATDSLSADFFVADFFARDLSSGEDSVQIFSGEIASVEFRG